jgi:large subunit ribosomal protein L25
VEESILNKLVFTPEVNGIELDLDGTKTLAMIHDKQFNPITDRVEHVDFLELKEGQPTRVKLALRLQGQPIGVRKGGKLNQSMRKLRVKGLPAHIPQLLEYDVTEMDINHTVRVKDLKFEGLTMMERADDVVFAVKQGKKVEVKTDAADDKKGKKK